MRYGFWLPVFGGWLRNLDDERMETSWAYTRQLCQRAEQLGSYLTSSPRSSRIAKATSK